MSRSILVASLLFATIAVAGEPRRLIAEGDVEASPAEVWRLWTTQEGVTSWMVPVAEVDLRLGGHLRTVYDPQGKVGDHGTITNTILAYEPERMLAIQNTEAPEGFPHEEGARGTWTVIYLEPLAGGRTHVRIVMLGWGEGPKADAAHAFFERGNAWTLTRLQERARTGRPLSWQ